MILHIGEAAALMFLAYMLGWAIGYFARRLAAGRPATATAASLTAESAEQKVPGPAPAFPPEIAAVDSILRDAIPRRVVVDSPPVEDGIATAPETPPAVRTASPPPATTVDTPWQAMQTSPPLYRPTVSAARPPSAAPDDPDDIVLLGRPGVAQVASPASSTAAGPALRPGLAWFGDLNGHPAPPHDSLLGRQTGGPNTVRLAARPQQITARPKAQSELAPVTEPQPEPVGVVAAAVPAPVAEPPRPVPEPPAEPRPLTSEAAPPVIEEPIMPIPAEAPSPALTVEPVRPDPENVEWEELPSATPVTPPPVRAARRAFERSTIASFGRTPAPPVVGSDTKPSEGAARGADQGAPAGVVAPPLPGTVATQGLQRPTTRQEPPPLPPVEPLAPKPSPKPDPVSAGEGDAAMNAIEGGSSRRRVRAFADRPEMIDVSAAVASAQSAVQQVLAQAGTEASTEHHPPGFGKPPGLPRARDGRRDTLREIIGVTSLDESTLNNLGIFHFDQIASWTDAEVLWLENHVFARGRVGREKWQDQAQKLVQRRPSPPRLARS